MIRALLATALLLLVAAWQVPPRLDWARYRAGIAQMAAARVGRPVQIAGEIHLSLIPHPILTAANVTLADRGDGMSANLGALRLQVAFWPLLAGRLVPRDLLLDNPVVSVPWPLPRVTPNGVHALPLGFGARVEGGTLRLNGFALEAIDADMRADADTGAFAATGTARLGGAPVHFSALIGAPGGDGIATLAVTIDGQQTLLGSGGSLRGRLLADGALAGMMAARGPDLSRLLPGPAEAWQLKGEVAAAGGALHAPQLNVMLGQSPGTAGLTLRLGPAPQLQAGLHIGRVALENWPWRSAAPSSALPMRLDLSADAATWRGISFGTPHILALLDTEHTVIEAAGTSLPAGGTLQLAGTLRPLAAGTQFSGPITVSAPDIRALATALHVPRAAAWPANMARPMTLRADLRAAPGQVSIGRMHGAVGGTDIDGDIGLVMAARPAVRLSLSIDQVTPLDWVGAAPGPATWQSLRDTGADLAVHVQAAQVALPDIQLHTLTLDATVDQTRLIVRRLAANLQGGRIEASGTLGSDGSLADATVDATVQDAGSLPHSWRVVPGLWHGPLHIAVSAAGPPRRIAVQLRCDLNDLRAEAEGHLDASPQVLGETATARALSETLTARALSETLTARALSEILTARALSEILTARALSEILTARALSATVTLRHPGAPRLLDALGVPDAGGWIGQGSVAVIAHIDAVPGLVQASDFSVAAGALRVGGAIRVDTTTEPPTLTGRIEAPLLTLPPLDAASDNPLPLGWLAGWQGSLDIATGPLVVGPDQRAGHVSANVSVGGGTVLAAGVLAGVAGGAFHGDAAVDTTQPGGAAWAVRGTLLGARPQAVGAWPPLVWSDGSVDVGGNLSATGFSPAAILASLGGALTGVAHGVTLQGVDLPRLARLLGARAPRGRRALLAALASGDTGPLTGDFAVTLDNGALSLGPVTLSGAAGGVTLGGNLDLPGRMADLALRVRPAVADPPLLGVRIAGPWQMLRRTTEVK